MVQMKHGILTMFIVKNRNEILWYLEVKKFTIFSGSNNSESCNGKLEKISGLNLNRFFFFEKLYSRSLSFKNRNGDLENLF